MLFDMSGGGLAFKPESPMSIGAWALLVFGLFSFVSFLGAIAESGWHAADPIARLLRGTVGAVWNVIGSVFGLFICAYTGVLLAVSNQPVWSDGWPLGGMFLASSLTGAVALLLLLAHSRRDVDAGTAVRLEVADRNFAILEAVLIAVFLITVAIAGTIGKVLGVWLLLWLVVAGGPGRAVRALARRSRAALAGDGADPWPAGPAGPARRRDLLRSNLAILKRDAGTARGFLRAGAPARGGLGAASRCSRG